MLGAITDFSSSKRGKWIVIAIWLVLSAVIVPLAPALDEVESNDQASFLPNGAESTRVVELVESRFPSDGTPAILVFHSNNGLDDADLAGVKQINDWLLSDAAPENVGSVISIFTQPQAAASLQSTDGRIMTMVVDISGESAEDPYIESIDAIREQTSAVAIEGLEIRVSGPGGLIADLVDVFSKIDGFLLLVTGILVLVLLVAIYRSPVIALVPLFAVGWVFSLAAAIGAFAAQEFGLPINGQSRGIMTVLLFGAGTDYCLFISSRFREELAHTQDKHEAMRRTMRAVGEAIASSAGTVLVATVALLLAVLESNKSLGPLLSVAVATMLVASLTLVPAIMTVLGRFAFWPFRPKYDPAAASSESEEAHGIWSRIARGVARRPAVFLGATVIAFLVMSVGTFRLEQTFDSLTSLPSGTESREGFEFLRESFPAGELSPTEAYIVLPEGTDVWTSLAAIDQVAMSLSTLDGIASVAGPSRPFGTAVEIGPDQVTSAVSTVPVDVRTGAAPPAFAPDSPEAQAFGLFASANRYVSRDGGVAKLDVVLDANPYSLEAIENVESLRQTARQLMREYGVPGEILIGGETATSYDTKVANDRDEKVVLPIILLAIGVILGLLLRSVVAPVYLLVTIIVSYFGTLGLSTFVFQDVLGQNGVGSSVPFFLFVFLVALGVDYNIYLMARIREESHRHGLDAGTRRALGRTGGVITSAGIILAGTFAALMTLPLQDLFQLGFAVAVGVLLDTFVVRSLMVPAIVLLLGKWNWWPADPHDPDTDPDEAPASAPA